MTGFSDSTFTEDMIHAALELSKEGWLLAVQVPGRDNPSLHHLKGDDAHGVLAKLEAAREGLANVRGRPGQVVLCYEAGYDGFWLARLLEEHGITCLVMEPSSLRVNPAGAAGEDRPGRCREHLADADCLGPG